MAWQNPSYAFLHAAADAGASAITPNATVDTSYPKDNLIDYRLSSLFKWSDSAANHTIVVDRGAAGLESIDRMIIPSGHNMFAASYKLQYSTTGAWGGEEVDAIPTGVVGAGIEDESFTGSTARYWRLLITSTGAWEIPQFVLTRTRSPSVGPDPQWDAIKVFNSVNLPFPTRTASLTLAPARWSYSLNYHILSGTDLAVFDDLFEECSDTIPFWFDGFETTDDPLYMKITRHSMRQQEMPVPQAAGFAYQVRFTMLEQTG